MSQPALALPPTAPKKVTVATLASYKARGRQILRFARDDIHFSTI
ncbi:MAG TPA: hypothetical protein VH539_19775 [Gemmatimonadaceae bacterium]|jgi:hypothetical protein